MSLVNPDLEYIYIDVDEKTILFKPVIEQTPYRRNFGELSKKNMKQWLYELQVEDGLKIVPSTRIRMQWKAKTDLTVVQILSELLNEE